MMFEYILSIMVMFNVVLIIIFSPSPIHLYSSDKLTREIDVRSERIQTDSILGPEMQRKFSKTFHHFHLIIFFSTLMAPLS